MSVLREFYEGGEATDTELKEAYNHALAAADDLEFRTTLNQPEDQLGAVLEINAGAGGTESCDWASMLMRMYVMWAENHDFKITEADRTDFSSAIGQRLENACRVDEVIAGFRLFQFCE